MHAVDKVTDLNELGFGERFTDELCKKLENATMFKDFSRLELENIVRYMHAYKSSKGAILLQEGDARSWCCPSYGAEDLSLGIGHRLLREDSPVDGEAGGPGAGGDPLGRAPAYLGARRHRLPPLFPPGGWAPADG